MLFYTDIFGEVHTKKDRDRIEKIIKRKHKDIKYDFLLTEEIGSLEAFTLKEKLNGIRNKQYGISSRSYDLAILLDIPVIGIDSWEDEIYKYDKKDENGIALDFSRSFKLREKRMLSVITEYAKKGNCAVIVGDAHLRTTQTKEFGTPSILQTELDPANGFFIYRSPDREIN